MQWNMMFVKIANISHYLLGTLIFINGCSSTPGEENESIIVSCQIRNEGSTLKVLNLSKETIYIPLKIHQNEFGDSIVFEAVHKLSNGLHKECYGFKEPPFKEILPDSSYSFIEFTDELSDKSLFLRIYFKHYSSIKGPINQYRFLEFEKDHSFLIKTREG